jgi:hypothetical protein
MRWALPSIVLVAAALLTAAPPGAAAAGAAACGLPDAQPLWIQYAEGAVGFRNDVFGRPGIVAATSGVLVPPALRARGAQTVHWEGKLGTFVGTTTKPADPATLEAAAQKLFDRAVTTTQCQTPWIALNELNGASTTTPWTATNSQYRANVLALLRALTAKGGRPFLLVNSVPYTGGDAADWWRAAAQVSDLVPEIYFNAPKVMRQGIVLGSRQMRIAFRKRIRDFLELGIPASRLGFVLGFQSGPGTGGREGLQPTSSWLRYVKLNTLAAKQVASELRIGTVWVWGWGTFNQAGADPDKGAAACVHLWTLTGDGSLCDGPAAAGEGFEVSLEEGQITLAAGVQCTLGERNLYKASIDRLTQVTRDREVAYTILYSRLVEDGSISPAQIVAAERALIAGRFDGSRPAYLRALAQARASVPIARGAIEDEIRRAEIERTLQVAPPREAELLEFYRLYADLLVRRIKADPAPHWLGGRKEGFVLAAAAPSALFRLTTGVEATLASGLATYEITPLDQPLPLGAVPYADVRPAIRTALVEFARARAYDDGSRMRQQRAQGSAICAADDFPDVNVVSITDYLPFLSLNA